MAQGNASGRKTSRIWLWIAGGVLGVFLLAVVGLTLYFTPERLRQAVVPVLESSLQRRVKLERIGLSLWGGIGASVQGLEVAERPGFGEVPFVQAGHAGMSLSIWPLLAGKAELGEIAIEGPKLSVVIDEHGEANYADLLEEEAQARAQPEEPRGVRLPIARLVLSEGTLRYEDRRSGTSALIDGIDYRVRLGLRGDGVDVMGDLSVADLSIRPAEGAEMVLGAFRLSHRLSAERGGDALAVESLRVGLGPVEMEATGWVRDISGVPELSLDVGEQAIAMGRLGAYLEEAGLSAEGGELGGEVRVSAQVEGRWDPDADPPVYPDVSAKIVLKGVSIRDPELPVPIEVGEATLVLEQWTLALPSLTIRAGRSDLSVDGRVQGLLDEWPYLTFKLTSKLLDLDEMIPPVASALPGRGRTGWGMAAPVYAAAPAALLDETSPVVSMVRAMDMSGTMQFGELKSDGVRYRDFRADVKAEERVLSLENIRADLYGGRVVGRAQVDARKPGGHLPMRASISADSVQANGLIQEFLKWGLPIYGRMGLSLTMSGAMDSTLELVPEKIRAEGSAEMREGKVVNWNLLKQASSMVPQFGALNFDEIQIRSLLAPFRVADGRVYLKELKVKAAEMDCRLSGSSGFDGSLDYTLDVDMPASQLKVGGMDLGGALGAFFGGGQATIPLRIRIGGMANRPQVKVGLQSVGKKQGREEPEDATKKLMEQGKGLLKKLF